MLDRDNRYYVYYHTDVLGNAFYVGKGSGDRAYSKVNRSAEWYRIADCGYEVNFYATDLLEVQALELETEIIRNPLDWELINKRAEFDIIDLDALVLSKVFAYSSTSQSGLVSKVTGKPIGAISSSGYWNVNFNNTKVRAHRVVWVLNNGPIPYGYVIHHKDCNRLNNVISNLELCSRLDNSRKRKDSVLGVLQPNNTSGILGISIRKYKGSNIDTVIAQWRDRVTGKRCSKSFSCSKYGRDAAIQLAVDYRNKMLLT